MNLEAIKDALFRRPRILWVVLAGMLLVSVLPLGLYHRQVLQLSQEKLTDTESVQQQEMTRSVADEVQLFDSNLYNQLVSERQILALTDLIGSVNDPVKAPQVTRLLEDFVASNSDNSPDILYLTAVGRDAKGVSAGSIAATRTRLYTTRCSGLSRLASDRWFFAATRLRMEKTTGPRSLWPFRSRWATNWAECSPRWSLLTGFCAA